MSSILIITIDTLRADHLEIYGYPRRTAPNLRRLAGEATTFEWAFAPISYTVPSLTSLMTGRWPSWHTARFSNMPCRGLASDCPPLARTAQQRGLETAAFVSTIVLSRQNCGLSQGFQVYDDRTDRAESNRPAFLFRRADRTEKAASTWLEQRGEAPFFLWVHFMDVHGPYCPPAPHDRRFNRDRRPLTPFDRLHLPLIPDPRFSGREPPGYLPGVPAYQALAADGGPGGQEGYVSAFRFYLDRYDGAVSYVDLACGRIISRLKKLGRYDDTTIVVHSDHGEALGEEGVFFFHGLTVTPDQIRVPLIIKSAGLGQGRRTDPVSLCDLKPFLLEELGAPPDQEDQGLNLARPSPAERIVPAQVRRQLALIQGSRMHLYGPGWFGPDLPGGLFEDPDWPAFLESSGPARRFDLRVDPLGLKNLENAAEGKEMDRQARNFISHAAAQSPEGREIEAGREEKEKLARKMRDLGYL